MKNKNKTKKLRILAFYELIISILVILYNIYYFVNFPESFKLFLLITPFIALVGIIGAILILKSIKVGWYLSLFWAIAQTIKLRVNNLAFDFSQLLHFNLLLNLSPVVDMAITINILGITLIIFFIKWRKEVMDK